MFIAAKSSLSRKLSLGLSILLADLAVGLFLVTLSDISNIWHGLIIMTLMGTIAGYIQIIFISWVQQQAKPEMLGRLMSIVMFGLVGLLPLGTSLAGVILQFVAIDSFFLMSGVALSVIAIVALCFSDIPAVKHANLSLYQSS